MERQAIDLGKPKPTVQTLDRIASVLGRERFAAGQTHVFQRAKAAVSADELSDSARILGLLEEMGESVVRELAGPGLDFRKLQPRTQSALMRLVNTHPGLASKMVAGEFVHVRLYGSPTAEYADPFTGQPRPTSLASFPFGSEAEVASRAKVASPPGVAGGSPVAPG